MAAGRTRLTFKTPVRKQRTPAKQNTQQKNKKPTVSSTIKKDQKDTTDPTNSDSKLVKDLKNEIPVNNSSVADYVNILEATRQKEQNMVQHYISENQELKKINPGHVYTKFTGLEIKNIKDKVYEFSWKINAKKLIFTLEENENDYCYEYKECENVQLPEALTGCITFDKGQYMNFYFNVLEMMLVKSH